MKNILTALKWKYIFLKRDINNYLKKRLKKRWGKLVAIGHREIGFDAELYYLQNYIKNELPLYFNNLSKNYKKLDDEIRTILNLIKNEEPIKTTIKERLEVLKKSRDSIDEQIQNLKN